MLATRPSSQPESAAATSASQQEEKNIPGVSSNALKEERAPLLDLDDVEQFESELAACFDAPPPPPLNIRVEEPVATVSSWTPTAEPRYVETVVAPPTPAEVAAAQARGELPQRRQEPEQGQQEQEQEQEQEHQQQQQAARVSDFSSLYSATPHIGESVGPLYPALVPSAPSSEAMRIPQPYSASASAAPAAAASSATVPMAAASGVEAARGTGAEVVSSGEVVEELLAENERLRLIITEMSEELDRASVRNGGGATASAAGARQGQSQAQRAEDTASVTPAQRLLGRYPGAQAEAARRQREREQQQQQSQGRQQQGQTQPQTQPQTLASVRPGQFVHFKCENCPQWLKVPGHAQLVYCPLCGHTSQMTSSSTIHIPPDDETRGNGGRASGATGTASGQGEDVGFVDYVKSIFIW
eukprot:g2974.t1